MSDSSPVTFTLLPIGFKTGATKARVPERLHQAVGNFQLQIGARLPELAPAPHYQNQTPMFHVANIAALGRSIRTYRPSELATEWNDAAFRHAYKPGNKQVALCGYDGPSTHKGQWTLPSNSCPICLALLPEYCDLAGKRWIK